MKGFNRFKTIFCRKSAAPTGSSVEGDRAIRVDIESDEGFVRRAALSRDHQPLLSRLDYSGRMIIKRGVA